MDGYEFLRDLENPALQEEHMMGVCDPQWALLSFLFYCLIVYFKIDLHYGCRI